MAVQMSCVSQFVFFLRFAQFHVRRQAFYPPYGPLEHVAPHVWVWNTIEASNAAAPQDDGGDEGEVCACCPRKHTTTLCGECSAKIIVLSVLTHTFVGTKLFVWHNICRMCLDSGIHRLCFMLCAL